MSGWLFVLRSLYGVILLLAPPRALAKLTRAPVDRRAAVVAKVLGVRELLQAELSRRHPDRPSQLTSAGVDGLHAATMFALAGADRDRRRLALHNGATATALALASAAAAARIKEDRKQ
jgi:hypothetical protein